VWIQYWVQLDTPAKEDDYRRYLVNYSDQQRASGRYERPTNVRLRSVMEWLDYNKVVPGDVRLQVWLAFGFLLVCLLNTVGLLLAGEVHALQQRGRRAPVAGRVEPRDLHAVPGRGRRGRHGRWNRRPGAGLARPVGRAPAAGQLRRAGAPGPADAADHLRARG